MRVRLRHLAEGLALCLALSIASAGFAATIDAVAVQPGGENTRVIFDVSSRVPFQVFTLENPHRVVVDLDSSHPRSGVNIGNTPVRRQRRHRHSRRAARQRRLPHRHRRGRPPAAECIHDRVADLRRRPPGRRTARRRHDADDRPSAAETGSFENDCVIGAHVGCNTHDAEQERPQRSECCRRAAA